MTISKESMSKKTMSKNTTSNELSISISSRSSKATGNKGRQNSLYKYEVNIKEERNIFMNNLQKTSY